jgi:hypothetical protein
MIKLRYKLRLQIDFKKDFDKKWLNRMKTGLDDSGKILHLGSNFFQTFFSAENRFSTVYSWGQFFVHFFPRKIKFRAIFIGELRTENCVKESDFPW